MSFLGIYSMGLVSPLGNIGPKDDSYWASLMAGKTAFKPVSFDSGEYGMKVCVSGEFSEFDSEAFNERIDWKGTPKFRRLDLVIQFGLAAAQLALEPLDFKRVNKNDIGIIAGSGLGGGRSNSNGLQLFAEEGFRKPRSYAFNVINTMPNALAGEASIHYGFHGPTYSVSSACSSSAHALACACNEIKAGNASAVLVIGSEAIAEAYYLACFEATAALSMSESLTASQPFGKNRSGFVMSEAAGAIVIADPTWAMEKGWRLIGLIEGYATNSGASDITQPNPIYAAACMKKAIDRTMLSPAEIGYVNTHGTSTLIGDPAEAEAIFRVFGSGEKSPVINSTKSLLGHTLGGAGIIEAITTLLSLRNQTTHPMGQYDLDEKCLYPIPEESNGIPLKLALEATSLRGIKHALTNNFGFGDHNATIILSIPEK